MNQDTRNLSALARRLEKEAKERDALIAALRGAIEDVDRKADSMQETINALDLRIQTLRENVQVQAGEIVQLKALTKHIPQDEGAMHRRVLALEEARGTAASPASPLAPKPGHYLKDRKPAEDEPAKLPAIPRSPLSHLPKPEGPQA